MKEIFDSKEQTEEEDKLTPNQMNDTFCKLIKLRPEGILEILKISLEERYKLIAELENDKEEE